MLSERADIMRRQQDSAAKPAKRDTESLFGVVRDVGEILEGEVWRMVGWLLSIREAVDALADVTKGDEALSLLFDIAACDSRGMWRVRRIRSAAAGALSNMIKCGPGGNLEAYVAGYGCLGKLASRLRGARGEGGWSVEEGIDLATLAISLIFYFSREVWSASPLNEWGGISGVAVLKDLVTWAREEGSEEEVSSCIECMGILVFASPSPALQASVASKAQSWALLRGGLEGVSSLKGCNQKAFDDILDILDAGLDAKDEMSVLST